MTVAGIAVLALLVVTPLIASAADDTGDTSPNCALEPVEDGCGTFTWPDGSTYIGEFRGGRFDGFGRISYAGGDNFEGEFIDASMVGDGIYTVSEGARIEGRVRDAIAGRASMEPQPEFPFWRAFFGDEASIEVGAVVLEDGSVTNVIVTVSSGSRRFDEAAIEAVSQWKLTPATIEGRPIKAPFFAIFHFVQPG